MVKYNSAIYFRLSDLDPKYEIYCETIQSGQVMFLKTLCNSRWSWFYLCHILYYHLQLIFVIHWEYTFYLFSCYYYYTWSIFMTNLRNKNITLWEVCHPENWKKIWILPCLYFEYIRFLSEIWPLCTPQTLWSQYRCNLSLK